ncbi:MAG: RluA family pseudouridine synthase [Victivallaceae bacterium]|nr:RluA family pseudouridine synthase [Victivallaceae bacterium]
MRNRGIIPGGRVARTSVTWDGAGMPLAGFLAMRFPYRGIDEWREAIGNGLITVNGAATEPDRALQINDIVEYHPDDIEEPPAELSYRILYEDDTVMAVEKPGNLCVHPAGPFFKHTLWHLLVSDFGKDIHFVNRLDRETSGLLIVAKTRQAAAKLGKQHMDRVYLATVHGAFPGRVEAAGFLFKDLESPIRKKRRFAFFVPNGSVDIESARTIFSRESESGGFSLVRAELDTGRMHQIRATLLALGHPVVGDKLYGFDESLYFRMKNDELTDEDRQNLLLPRQALHSHFIGFVHPVSGERVEVTSPVPKEMTPGFLVPRN